MVTEDRPVRRPTRVALSDTERMRLQVYARSKGLTTGAAVRELIYRATN